MFVATFEMEFSLRRKSIEKLTQSKMPPNADYRA